MIFISLFSILFIWLISMTVFVFSFAETTENKFIVLDDALYIGITEQQFKKQNGFPYTASEYVLKTLVDRFNINIKWQQ
jgi:ABC-type Na+ efflux pump permease subunit